MPLHVRGNYNYWRDPFFTSMIMGGRVKKTGRKYLICWTTVNWSKLRASTLSLFSLRAVAQRSLRLCLEQAMMQMKLLSEACISWDELEKWQTKALKVVATRPRFWLVTSCNTCLRGFTLHTKSCKGVCKYLKETNPKMILAPKKGDKKGMLHSSTDSRYHW